MHNWAGTAREHYFGVREMKTYSHFGEEMDKKFNIGF
jgi:hypothetical protein